MSGADLFPSQPQIPARVFQLTDFGAASGAHPPTQIFDSAIAAIKAAGGGTLVVPAGTWFTLPFGLCSNLNLHLEKGARILFSPNFDDYRLGETGKFRPLLDTIDCHDVMISGEGTIDGNGSAWWPSAIEFKEEANRKHLSNNTSPRPKMVVFERCQRIRVEGVTLTNSPVFNLVPMSCTDVTIEGITIYNPYLASPNTDGIDPSASSRVLISHCVIDTDDDNIAIKAGTKGAPPMEDILVTDCTFRHGHGCSIGSETFSGLRNMTVQRCTFDGTETGIRFKSDRKRGGLVENITYQDLVMKNVGVAISITSYYAMTTSDNAIDDKPAAVTATTPHWKNITIRNVTSGSGRKAAGLIVGVPEMPAEVIRLTNVVLEAPTGIKIRNAKNLLFDHVVVHAAKGAPIDANASVTGLVQTN
jgi:polygalacturonase